MMFKEITAVTVAALLLGGENSAVLAQKKPEAAEHRAVQSSPVTTPERQINEDILDELKAIHRLLEQLATAPSGAGEKRPPATTTVKLTDLAGYTLGRADAPLTMVEFTDLQCPFCQQYALTTFKEIERKWIAAGKLRYISRDLPLAFHPLAMTSARAARCAGEQGKFWDMRETLMRNGNLLTPAYISSVAATMGLDSAIFSACVGSTKYDSAIESEAKQGIAIGLEGTPAFVIGRTAPTVLQGSVILGAVSYATLDARLKQLLGPNE